MLSLYGFQEEALSELLGGKHIIVATMGMGKNPMSMVWAARKCKEAGKDKILVVTTASKAKTNDHADDFERFVLEKDRRGITIIIISWHKLRAWVDVHRLADLAEYVYVFDEIQRAGAGASSGMGRAFLSIAKKTKDWSGWTGTPGDTWLKFYPYFTACGLVKNKTQFMNRYAYVQTYKGYPEIAGWRYEDELKDMWAHISYAPDTHRALQELPNETHKVFTFSKPKTYARVLKTRQNANGEFLDTSGALCAELRRLCFTSDKKQWVADFVDGLDSGCVFFYNFVKTGDELEKIIQKALPKGAKVWRIDGTHHDVPTAETIGPKDMVLCQWQSGSEALNLQFLHYWCSVEACYSYSTSVQARGRIKRIGQEHPMYFAYLKTENTIEDDVYEALATKSEFSQKNWCINNNIIIEEGE